MLKLERLKVKRGRLRHMAKQEHHGQCCCGQLSISFHGDPKRVLSCSCDHCLRRTGAIVQTTAWFTQDQLAKRQGEETHYISPNQGGVEYSFCPKCGSTVFWKNSVMRDQHNRPIFGVAVGCLADPDFPKPTIECWASKRHSWLPALSAEEIYEEFPEKFPDIEAD